MAVSQHGLFHVFIVKSQSCCMALVTATVLLLPIIMTIIATNYYQNMVATSYIIQNPNRIMQLPRDNTCMTNKINDGCLSRRHHHRNVPIGYKVLQMHESSMNEYIGEGIWDDAFITEQIALVPHVQIVTKMPEPILHENCNNMYYLLRHGQSTANVAEIISSDRYTLSYTNKHGLTELGIQQGTESAQQLLTCILNRIQSKVSTSNNINQIENDHHRILFITSPFARARQTADACCKEIQELVQNTNIPYSIEVVTPISINNLLVERYFGIYDNDILEKYGYVWPLDQRNVLQTNDNVESVAAVATRIQSLIEQLEEYTYNINNNSNNNDNAMFHIVLVSHGDVLQIAQLYAANVPNVGEFSSYRFQSMY
jgi:broad specificity phosphatase PhoE